MKKNHILHYLAKGQLIWGRQFSETQRHSAAKILFFLLLATVKHGVTSYWPVSVLITCLVTQVYLGFIHLILLEKEQKHTQKKNKILDK